MKAQEAQRFPLFKEFGFPLHFGAHGGQGILLIPQKNSEVYFSKEYGFGELNLAPYLQVPFNQGKSITLRELMEELEDENEIRLASKPIGNERWFLASVINKFAKHGIINLDKRLAEKYKISNYDILSQGDAYNQTRVYKMDSYRGESLFEDPLMPRLPVF